MTEVRLTATTEDGQVVQVLADASGRLRLEEPIITEGPPGPKGDPGEPGRKGDPGDPFSGNFIGDVYFDGNVGIGATNPGANLVIANETNSSKNGLEFDIDNSNAGNRLLSYDRNSGERTAFNIDASEFTYKASNNDVRVRVNSAGNVGIGTNNPRTKFDVEGCKAGFTAEGNLFCTTVRGDLVILANTSNGIGYWEDYEPPFTADLLEEKLEEWSKKDKFPESKPIQD